MGVNKKSYKMLGNKEWYETQANRMSYRYFNNHGAGGTYIIWDDKKYIRNYKFTWYWMFFNPGLNSWVLFF
jgi:hypothetical protein